MGLRNTLGRTCARATVLARVLVSIATVLAGRENEENARKSSRLPRHSAASAAFVLLPLLRVALQDDKKTHENTHEVHK